MREETEAARGGKGRGPLSSAFPFWSWLKTNSLTLQPRPPMTTTTEWGSTAVDLQLKKCRKEGSSPSGGRKGPRGTSRLGK